MAGLMKAAPGEGQASLPYMEAVVADGKRRVLRPTLEGAGLWKLICLAGATGVRLGSLSHKTYYLNGFSKVN